MQPDLLSPEKEESQPASSSAEVALLEMHPSEESNPSPAGRKRSRFNPVYLVLGVLVFLLLAAFAWVGYWAYDLSTQLSTTQQQMAALQADHTQLETEYETLKAENENLNTALTQTKADLEKSNTDLAAAQSDLGKSRDQVNDLKNKITKAGKLAEVLYTWTNMNGPGDILKVDGLIGETNNQELQKEWDNFTKDASQESFGRFLKVLILAMRDSLK
jgi:cell division protein FtsB